MKTLQILCLIAILHTVSTHKTLFDSNERALHGLHKAGAVDLLNDLAYGRECVVLGIGGDDISYAWVVLQLNESERLYINPLNGSRC